MNRWVACAAFKGLELYDGKLSRTVLMGRRAASQLSDLKVPPGNMLEPLYGDRQGEHSIRINKQFRVCFRWTKAGAEDVEIVDYH